MSGLLGLWLRGWAWLPLPLVHLFGDLLGTLAYWVPNGLRTVTRLHLAVCLAELPQSDRRRIERECLRQVAKTVLEAPAIWFGPRRRLERWLDDPRARRRLQDAIATTRGAIILCPHVGSWELAGMFCASVAPITSLYKPQKGAIDTLIRDGRGRLGAQLVPTEGAGVRALLQALKRGETVGILPDHDPPRGSGVFAPLFGLPAHTSDLVPKLAARTGAGVWFCYAERLPWARGFRFHVVAAPSGIDDPDTGPTALNRGIEAIVTHLPEQYWWSYKRYRRQPPGSQNPYRYLRRR